MIEIKPLKKENLLDTRNICFETSRSFHTDEKKEMLWLLYHDYYYLNDIDSCFIAFDNLLQKVVGYVFCAPNFDKYEKFFKDNLIPKISQLDVKLNSNYANERIKEFSVYKKFSKDYPAHLHINILPEYQGQGIGKILLEALDSNLKKKNVSGIMLITGLKNINAQKLYLKNGYEVLESLNSGCIFGKSMLFKKEKINWIKKT